MFEPDPSPIDDWTADHQYAYSLLWSSFLDLDVTALGGHRKRFYPYSTEFVARELLWPYPDVQAMGIGGPSSRLADSRVTLAEPFVRLALWTLVPNLFQPRGASDDARPSGRRRGAAARERLAALGRILCDHFKAGARRTGASAGAGVAGGHADTLRLDLAAFGLDDQSRPVLPPFPDLGIGDAAVTVHAGRRSASARLSCPVQIPFGDELQRAVDPRGWGTFVYWRPVEGSARDGDLRHLRMRLCLPGGNLAAPDVKWRALDLSYVTSAGAFGARTDFHATEPVHDEPGEDDACPDLPDEASFLEEPPDQPTSPGLPCAERDAVHVRDLRGYLSIEKIPGRPGWTSFVTEREARFGSPNHDRFRVETLMFWAAVDLLSFATTYRVRVARTR